jgi:hypothetical protein
VEVAAQAAAPQQVVYKLPATVGMGEAGVLV